jgi:hypothetical protein
MKAATPGSFEECADELRDLVSSLERYPHTVLAFVLRAHLCGLLQALRLHGQWTAAQVAKFLQEMASETLHPE